MFAFQITAFAGVLGNLTWDEGYIIANGARFTRSVFMSEQAGVGQQTDYYFEYTPNMDVVPIITNGDGIYGRTDMNQNVSYLKNNGINPVAGLNGDFFSLNTGVPNGHVIKGGKIHSFSEGIQPAIGFRQDSTGFIADLALSCSFQIGTVSREIKNFNKFLQPYGYYLYDRDFDVSTRSGKQAANAVFQIINGEARPGQTVYAKLIEIIEAPNAAIPAGHFVLSIDVEADSALVDELINFPMNSTATFSFASNNSQWNNVAYALGTTAGQIVKDGVYTNSNVVSGANPRTAVGIKSNGDIIFYAIDGRQTGHSFGVQTATLAARMIELGCSQAINLDGGGSTTIGSVQAGNVEFAINNNPSDGVLRKNGTFLFLINKNQPTGVLDKLFMYPSKIYALKGVETKVATRGTDKHYYAINVSGLPFYYSSDSKNVTIDQAGNIKVLGEANARITVEHNGIKGYMDVIGVETPTGIKVFSGKNEIKDTIYAKKGDEIPLDLKAYLDYREISGVSNAGFEVAVDPSIGYYNIIDRKIVITASHLFDSAVEIKAGNLAKTFRINSNKVIFEDVGEEHWAAQYIQKLVASGSVQGYEENGKMFYGPSKNITRQELMVIIARGLGISQNEGAGIKYADEKDTADWSINYIKALLAKGYIKGDNDDVAKSKIRPKDAISRAEAVTIIGRVLKEIDYKEYPTIDFIEKFTDKNKIPQWSLEFFQRLVADEIIGGYEDGSVKPLNNITRAEAAKILSLVFEGINK